jgi:hypothetical protein
VESVTYSIRMSPLFRPLSGDSAADHLAGRARDAKTRDSHASVLRSETVAYAEAVRQEENRGRTTGGERRILALSGRAVRDLGTGVPPGPRMAETAMPQCAEFLQSSTSPSSQASRTSAPDRSIAGEADEGAVAAFFRPLSRSCMFVNWDWRTERWRQSRSCSFGPEGWETSS